MKIPQILQVKFIKIIQQCAEVIQRVTVFVFTLEVLLLLQIRGILMHEIATVTFNIFTYNTVSYLCLNLKF